MVGSFKLKKYSWSILKKSVFLREKGEDVMMKLYTDLSKIRKLFCITKKNPWFYYSCVENARRQRLFLSMHSGLFVVVTNCCCCFNCCSCNNFFFWW